MTPEISRLPNGVRVASLNMPGAKSFSIAVFVASGSRDEPARLNGISHFLEHLLFKGTPTRSARKISETVEGVGGDINALTSEEVTTFYATAPTDYLPKVADVLFDMFSNPRLAEKDIELERGVIAEEIQMYRDEPDQHVHELLGGLLWPNHPLGRPIAGSEESIQRFTREDFVAHRKRHHHAEKTLVVAAGGVEHERLVRLVERFLHPPEKSASPRRTPAPNSERQQPVVLFEQRDTAQTHVSIGLPGPTIHDADRHAASLLVGILGGTSSSRLFQELRERRGLCYSVQSGFDLYSDTGTIGISIGLDARQLEYCLRLILKNLHALREKGCTDAELRRVKEYSIGAAKIALERSSAQVNRIARSLLNYGRVIPIEEYDELTRAVTRQDVQEAAQKYLNPRKICMALIGPSASPERLKELLAG